MTDGTTGRGWRVVVIGQGYVGLPLAMRAAEVGHDVVGFDLASGKIKGLVKGTSHIDDITDADVERALQSGRFLPTENTSDLKGFDVAIITVPTPLKEGAPDLSYIEIAGNLLAKYITPGATIVLESTTYPGTTEKLLAPILEEGSNLKAGRDFHLGFSPERIDPGNQTWGLQQTPKVVSGIDPESLEQIRGFYDTIVDTTVATSGTAEAEMSKLLENTFRHVNIALVNELAIHARRLGIDFWDVIEAAATKPFGFMPFYPGPGVGGHCLPIDPSYLSWRFEQELNSVSKFVKIANDVNQNMPRQIAYRIQLGLNERSKSVKGSRVLILGVAYKGDSNDARETPATPLINQLLELGANVRVHDSWVDRYELDDVAPRADLTADEVSAADVVVLVTNHSDVDYSLVANNADYVFDTRHHLTGDNIEHI